MPDLTIEAVRVARSVGRLRAGWRVRGVAGMAAGHEGIWLPDRIRDGWGYLETWHDRQWQRLRVQSLTEIEVVLDEETAFGVALKLDEWERARDPLWSDGLGADGWGLGMSWASWVADEPGNPVPLRALIARITQIYYDHEIRRVWFGEPVAPGTLGILEYWENDGVWAFKAPGWGQDGIGRGQDSMIRTYCLPDITDADEALVALHAEVCGG